MDTSKRVNIFNQHFNYLAVINNCIKMLTLFGYLFCIYFVLFCILYL